MATKNEIYKWWRKSGFSAQEAKELTYGKEGVEVDSEKVYFSTPAVIARKERGKWIRKLKAAGWSNKKIADSISRYYSKINEASPWDFIRENYRSMGLMEIKQYREIAAEKARENTNQLYKQGKTVRQVSTELGNLIHREDK